MTGHGDVGPVGFGGLLDPLAVATLVAGAVALLGYRLLMLSCRARARSWAWHCGAAWTAGVLVAVLAVVGPVADLGPATPSTSVPPVTSGTRAGAGSVAEASFVGHMVTHLLLGMVAPVLLVLGAPVRLALRALPVEAARRVSGVLSGRPVRFLSEPVIGALLVGGGSWLLYATPAYALVHHDPLLAVLLQVHLLASGCLFTAAVLGVDPMPHRRGVAHRTGVLVLSLAAHDVLAKWLYAHPPVGLNRAEAERAAVLMYDGGTVVDLALAVLLLAGWYRRTRPRTRDDRACVVADRASRAYRMG